MNNFDNEIWKPIAGFENYEISNFGRVRSLHYRNTNNIVVLQHSSTGGNGYYKAHLTKNGKKHSIEIHRLVAMAFLPNPNNLPCVNHINEIKTDNRVENLEWCNYSYNNSYGIGNQKRTTSKIKTWSLKKVA